jgi:MFS transporter, FSR family, fosmidomycin resistance protein
MLDRAYRTTLAFSSLGHFYAHLLMLLFPTVVLALEPAFGMPFHELIGLMLLGNVLFGAAAVPAGYLGDRWSASAMMVLYFIGTGTAAVITGFATSPFQVGAGLALIGLFAAIYHPVGIAWVVRQARDRGKALGINGLFGAAGTGAAPLVAALLVDLWSWRAAFILPGLVCLATGGVLLVAIHRGLVHDDKAMVSTLKSEAPAGDMRRAALVLAITIACSGLIYQATSFALPKMFESRLAGALGPGLIGVGALVSAVYFLSAGAQILGGWLADRFNLKRVYMMCWAIQAPLLLFAATIDSMLLFPVAVVMVLANTTGVPSENSLFARYTPPRWRGTAFGVKFLLSLGVAAMAVPLIAWIHGSTGSFYWLLAILAGLAATATLAASQLPGAVRDPVRRVQPAE